MIAKGAWAAAALCVMVSALAGCKKKPEVSVETRADVVEIHAYAADEFTMTVRGKSAKGSSTTLYFAALELPAGAQTIDVDIERGGKHEKISLPFDRKPIAPALQFYPRSPDDEHVTCTGDFCSGKTNGLSIADTKLTADIAAPPGATIEVAGQKVAAPAVDPLKGKESSTASFTIDLRDRVPDSQSDIVLNGGGTYDLPAKITTDSMMEGALKLSMDAMARATWTVAREIEKGPITFAADDVAAKGGPRSIVIAGDQFIGKPAKFREVDLIAVSKSTERPGGRSCGPYRGPSGASTSATLVLIDVDVKVYDRRTGKLVKQKAFDAKGDCPSVAMGSRAESRASFVDVRAWLKTLVRP